MESSGGPLSRRVGRCRVGGMDHMEAMAGLPDGPPTLGELFDWPTWAFNKLENSDAGEYRIKQLRQNAMRTVHVHSSYSGKGTDGTISMHINKMVLLQGLVPAGHQAITCTHACDIDASCLKVLSRMKCDDKNIYEHVFGDMHRRIRDEHHAHLKLLTPPISASLKVKGLAYIEMMSYLKAAARAGDLVNPTDYCHVHKRHCPVHAICASGHSSTPEGAIMQPLKRSRTQEFPEPLKGFVAGSSCEDFARYGDRLGPSGPRMKEWTLTVSEIHGMDLDFAFFEISDTCPVEFYAKAFECFQFISGVVSPNLMGWPVKRPRRYTFGYKPGKFHFTGSFEDYLQTFSACPVLLGDSLLLASHSERQAFMRKRAELHGHFFGMQTDIGLDSCLTAAEFQRLQAAKRLVPLKGSVSGVCVTDIEQNACFVNPGPYVPTLVKHGKLVSLSTDESVADKIFTPKEHLAIMGEPCFASCASKEYPSYMWDIAQQHCSDSSLIKMSGNAMHMVNLGTFMLYCLSCLTGKATTANLAFDFEADGMGDME